MIKSSNVKMKYIIILFFVLVQNGLCQTSSKYKHIDDYVVSFDSNAITPEKLVRALIKKKWTEDEKVRAIYGWIARNIHYDMTMDRLNNKQDIDESKIVMETFSMRRGTCYNYSLLFHYMCKSIGIEVKVINGYVKWLPSHVGKSSSKMDYHAWNMVKTNGKYHLIEVTWATASPRHFEYYFYPDPKCFIATHYSDGKDQLLSVPVKKEEFDKYPYISDCFFFEKKDKVFPKQGTIITNNEQIELKINYPDSLYLTPNIFMETGLYYPPCVFKKVGQTLFLSVKIPQGEHVLTLGLDCNGFLAYRVIYKKDNLE